MKGWGFFLHLKLFSMIWPHSVSNFSETTGTLFARKPFSMWITSWPSVPWRKQRKERFIMISPYLKYWFPHNPLLPEILNSEIIGCDCEIFMLIYLLLELFCRWKWSGLDDLLYRIYSGEFFFFHRSYPLELCVFELPPGRGISHLSNSCQVGFCACLELVDLNARETHHTVRVQLNFR